MASDNYGKYIVPAPIMYMDFPLTGQYAPKEDGNK